MPHFRGSPLGYQSSMGLLPVRKLEVILEPMDDGGFVAPVEKPGHRPSWGGAIMKALIEASSSHAVAVQNTRFFSFVRWTPRFPLARLAWRLDTMAKKKNPGR